MDPAQTDPTGDANTDGTANGLAFALEESGTTLRTLRIEVPHPTLPTFYRARVVME